MRLTVSSGDVSPVHPSTGDLRQAEPGPELPLGVTQARMHRALLGALLTEHKIDRFTLIESVGRGGMGEVFAAYDPKLDRRVAIKLVSTAMRAGGGPGGQDELMVEARAMAKVSHPNVVSVFEVGVHHPTHGEPSVFIAMEFVQGKTLRTWVRDSKPAWPRIVSAYAAAGRGLAAMHAAGLVHRDFKADNVMIDDDGHVRVMDFGLAHDLDHAGGGEATVAELGRALEALTQKGRLAGTPAYMAPEQLEGRRADARSDQFALCVSLYEALWGRRPWDASSVTELVIAMLESSDPPPPPRGPVPLRIRRAILRGLSRDSMDRWPGMHALLHALGVSSTRAWRRVALGMVVVATGAAAAWAYGGYARGQRIAACEATGDEIEAAWNDERRQALRAALVRTGVSHAETTADKTIPWLDEQATQWRRARVETCLDGSVRALWDADMEVRSLWCLDERRMQLESLVDELTLADAEVLKWAVTAATGLASVDPCRDPRALETLVPPPSEQAEAVRLVRADVTRVGALEQAGRFQAGLELARLAVQRAEALEWRPLLAAARFRLGALLYRTGAHAEAETTLEAAYFEAIEGDAPEVAFDAATELVVVVGTSSSSRHAEGLRWGKHAEMALADAHDGQDLRRATLLNHLAGVHHSAGNDDRAVALLEDALTIRIEALGSDHPEVAVILSNLAKIRLTSGEVREAKALVERALVTSERVLGPEHPDVGQALMTLAAVHEKLGDYEDAKVLYQRSLAIKERVLGPNHPGLARNLYYLASIDQAQGAYDEAEAVYQRSLAIAEQNFGPEHLNVTASLFGLAGIHESKGDHEQAKALYLRSLAIGEKALGPEHPDMAWELDGLARVEIATGAYEEAEALCERSLAIREAALGPEHPSVGESLVCIADIRRMTGDFDEAKMHYERALAIYERALARDHRDVAKPLVGLAEVALAQRRTIDAVALAQRAVAVRERGGVTVEQQAEARFVLAQALWAASATSGPDRKHAVALAEQARDAYRQVGSGGAARLADVETWLEAHRMP